MQYISFDIYGCCCFQVSPTDNAAFAPIISALNSVTYPGTYLSQHKHHKNILPNPAFPHRHTQKCPPSQSFFNHFPAPIKISYHIFLISNLLMSPWFCGSCIDDKMPPFSHFTTIYSLKL